MLFQSFWTNPIVSLICFNNPPPVVSEWLSNADFSEPYPDYNEINTLYKQHHHEHVTLSIFSLMTNPYLAIH